MYIIILGELNGAKMNISQGNMLCFYHGYIRCIVAANFNAVALSARAGYLKSIYGKRAR